MRESQAGINPCPQIQSKENKMTTEEKLAELSLELFTAKKAEESNKALRIEIEEKIIALVEVEENQSKTFKAGDLKVTVKKELAYSVDEENLFGAGIASSALERVFDRVPESFKFNAKGYELLNRDDPEAFKAIAPFVTTKPKKTSVTLKL